MSYNSKGSYPTTPELMMRAFDKLPRQLRETFANADDNYVPQRHLTYLKRGGCVRECINSIERSDLLRRTMRRMRRVWGPGHPQAIPE